MLSLAEKDDVERKKQEILMIIRADAIKGPVDFICQHISHIPHAILVPHCVFVYVRTRMTPKS